MLNQWLYIIVLSGYQVVVIMLEVVDWAEVALLVLCWLSSIALLVEVCKRRRDGRRHGG
jgi:type IV secretory pathway TrbD component